MPAAELDAIIKRLRLVVFDFDGVFTDNTVWVGEDGRESVRCWRGDGLGLKSLERLGLEVAVLSTEENPVVGVRCRKLGVRCIQGSKDKGRSLCDLLRTLGVEPEQTAYVGNDINDAECLRMVALPIVPSDAHRTVLSLARWRTRAPGGFGAVREVCDRIGSAFAGTT